MLTVASTYLRFYVKVRVGVSTCLLTPAPPKIHSDSNSTAAIRIVGVSAKVQTRHLPDTNQK
jgi:hypothetical protein